MTPFESFIEDLEIIYTKAMNANKLEIALKTKELIAKCYGYFIKSKVLSIKKMTQNDIKKLRLEEEEFLKNQ